MATSPNAPKPPKAQAATVHSLEYARAYSILERTPEHRRKKCYELLKEQIDLESQLRNVRSMLDALSDTDREAFISQPVTMLKRPRKGSTPASTEHATGRI